MAVGRWVDGRRRSVGWMVPGVHRRVRVMGHHHGRRRIASMVWYRTGRTWVATIHVRRWCPRVMPRWRREVFFLLASFATCASPLSSTW